MDWFKKLNEYFTVEEMKSKKNIEMLLTEKGDVYYKDEGPHHVFMYAEFSRFVFIDYLWVSAESRGQGLGHSLIDKLKAKNKPIILEVEPRSEEHTSELQSRGHLVCRLLLEKKKNNSNQITTTRKYTI